jgi:hypothetical protein
MLLEMQHLLTQDATLMLHNESARIIHLRAAADTRKFVRAARNRTIEIQAGAHTVTAAGPMPAGLRDVLDHIDGRSGVH